MAIAKDFFAAAIPEPWQILGVKLRPFSLGHYLKLSRLGCAFVSEQETNASLSDLILGCIVCSMPTTVDQEADPFWLWLGRTTGGLKYKLHAAKQRMLGKKIPTPAEYDCFIWGEQLGSKINLAEKIQQFKSYLDSNSVVPPYVEIKRESSGHTSGAHWTHSVLSALVSRCGYDMEQALNVPVSRALSDFIKQAETDGAVSILPSEVVA